MGSKLTLGMFCHHSIQQYNTQLRGAPKTAETSESSCMSILYSHICHFIAVAFITESDSKETIKAPQNTENVSETF